MVLCATVRARYSKGDFHTNSIEGFWSLLKRQIIGIHHQVSAKHLHRYVSESAWRFNLRQIGEGDRVNAIMAEYFQQPYPARAAVGVASLPRNAAVEMDAVMVLGG